jgi:hypothetical protein
MDMTRQLTIEPSLPTVTIAILAVVAAMGLAFYAWRRTGYDRGTGWLELLRVVLVGMAAYVLLQPEMKETIIPEKRPTLAVLWDDSQSMTTRDVLEGSNEAPGGPPETREKWMEDCLKSPLWDELREKLDVVIEPFSGPEGEEAGTDIHGAMLAALERTDNLRAVALLSDGDWNAGKSPVVAARQLRVKQVPVFAVSVGSDVALPDIEVAALDPPTFSVVGKSLQIPFTIKSTLSRDYSVPVTLAIEGGIELTKDIIVPAKGQVRDALFWKPEEVGDVSMTLTVPPHANEAITENNQRSVEVAIRAESLKVLVVESLPRWEYRYLRNALERDPGVEVSCLLFHPGLERNGGGPGYLDEFPATPEELAKYDVVFLGDVGVGQDQLTTEQCEMLKGLVEQQASGLVFIPGMRGKQFSLLSTALEELYPVSLDSSQMRGFGSRVPSRFLLTEAGRRNLLTKLADTEEENMAVWQGLPGFQWRSPAIRNKAGTAVLAIDEDSRAPLLVTKSYGTGKVLFMGTDSAWRWREGVEDKYHYRFWGQVARWMAYQRHMAKGELLRLFFTPDRPVPGGAVTLNATVLDPNGAPMQDASLTAEVTDPQGVKQTIRFRTAGSDWGLYQATFVPHQAGSYQVQLSCKETSAYLETTMHVLGEEREKLGKPANFEVLQEIAQVSRGDWYDASQWKKLREAVLAIPDPEPLVRRRQIWASPWYAGALVGLMGVFWVGRKLKGTI